MITSCISFLALICSFVACRFGIGIGTGWSVFISIAVFFTSQICFSLYFRKRINAAMGEIQRIMAEGQNAIKSKMAAWQFRPPGSMKEAQRIIEADTKKFVQKALEATKGLERLRHWVPLIDSQIATARLHLNWMIKNFDEVDALMPKAMLRDPVSASMKMARLQMKSAPLDEIEKVYKKAVARCRYNDNVIPAACWSWILVERGETDRAFIALGEALKKSDNEVLKRNHELLMNNKPAHFSNTALGDQWFALHLEEPKIRQQRQRPQYR